MFGKQKVKEGYEFVEKSFGGEYMGGHMLYPKKTDATVDLFAKHLDIQFGSIHKHIIRIPYETIAKIGTEDEQRITKTRVLMTPLLIGLLWKKKFRYTVIDYKEAGIDQCVIIDFHREAEKAQQLIYAKMIEARQLQKGGEIR